MRLILAAGLMIACCAAARAAEPAPSAGALCTAAIDHAEHSLLIPDGLLGAIGRVESGVADPAMRRVVSWPWTIDVGGVGRFYPSKAEAVAAVAELQAQGVRSIDVGCLQVNLMYHPTAFANLDQAFDPAANVLYAGQFLRRLFVQTASWSLAAGAYHSQTPELGTEYRERVLNQWGGGRGRASVPTVQAAGTVYGAFAPAQTVYAAFAPAQTIYAAFPPADSVYGAFAVPAGPARAAPLRPRPVRTARNRSG